MAARTHHSQIDHQDREQPLSLIEEGRYPKNRLLFGYVIKRVSTWPLARLLFDLTRSMAVVWPHKHTVSTSAFREVHTRHSKLAHDDLPDPPRRPRGEELLPGVIQSIHTRSRRAYMRSVLRMQGVTEPAGTHPARRGCTMRSWCPGSVSYTHLTLPTICSV